jgi:hypothetical protein
MEQGNILTYEGPFGIQIISALAKFLRENCDASELTRVKLYKVFIELAQNVALYSLDKVKFFNNSDIGKGKVNVIEAGNNLYCTTINEIQKEHGYILNANCAEINKATKNELQIKKKKLHRLAEFEDTGAHVGLIMISFYSENPLSYEIINDKDTDKMYFKISAIIKKL